MDKAVKIKVKAIAKTEMTYLKSTNGNNHVDNFIFFFDFFQSAFIFIVILVCINNYFLQCGPNKLFHMFWQMFVYSLLVLIPVS